MNTPTFRIALLLLAWATAASAAPTTSSLTGTVRVGDAPAQWITVTVASPALVQPRVATTGKSGRYWIGSLPPGAYEVTFSGPGLTSLTVRAVVELARVARADGRLERSEDEESTTSTVRNVTVADTTAVTTHFSHAEIERLPLPRTAEAVADIAPGDAPMVDLDDVPFAGASLLGEELLEEVTVLRAGLPVTQPGIYGGVVVARTHSPGERLSLSIRDTISSSAWTSNAIDGTDGPEGLRHLFEIQGGGPAGGTLRFFAAAWGGDAADRARDDLRGSAVRIHWAPAAAHSVEAQYLDAQSAARVDTPSGASMAALRYTGVASRRSVVDLHAWTSSRGDTLSLGAAQPPFLATEGRDGATARITTFSSGRAGDHVLSLGASLRSEWFDARDHGVERETSVFFASDRWSAGPLVVEAGLRRRHVRPEPDAIPGRDGWRTSPRLALAWDLTGNGRHAISATHGMFELDTGGPTRSTSAGYAIAFGSSGSARFDVIRHRAGGRTVDQLQAEGRYRLFERYEAGATHTRSSADALAPRVFRDVVSGWAGLEIPVGEQQFGLTLLQRLAAGEGARTRSTGIAFRYRRPVGGTALTAALDATGLFRRGDPLRERRAVRVWLRLDL